MDNLLNGSWTIHSLATWALILALSPGSAAVGQDPPDQTTAYMMDHSWTSSQEAAHARGLSFFQSSDRGLSSMILVESPGDGRVVLSNMLSVPHAWDQVILRDDRTGWWFEISQRYDVQASGLREFLRKSMDWYIPGDGRSVTFRARSSGGLRFSHEVEIKTDPQDMYRAFADALRSEGLAAELSAEIPDTLIETIAFLDAALQDATKRSVIDVLVSIAPAKMSRWRYADADWKGQTGMAGRGVSVSSAELLSFTSTFDTIETEGPLSELPLGLVELETPPEPTAR